MDRDLERAVAQAEITLQQAQLRLERLQEPPEESDVAIARAKQRSPAADTSVFDVIRRLLLDWGETVQPKRRAEISDFVMRFQQYTAPIVAKAQAALSDEWPKPALTIAMGGSIPVVGTFADVLGVPILLVGFGLPVDVYDLRLYTMAQASLAGTLLDSVEYLAGYPYGCIEQTMSRFLPTLMVAQTLRWNPVIRKARSVACAAIRPPHQWPTEKPARTTAMIDVQV